MVVFLISAIKIIILLGFLIFIHELGHFLVAKLCKVKVNEFALGFGPKIWSKQGAETKYALRLIPLGGFVSMEGEEERSEDKRSFSQVSIPKRIAIVVAGAIVNIIFAMLVYFILTASAGPYTGNEISEVMDGYAAQEVGMQAGDNIIAVGDTKIKSRQDLNKAVLELNGQSADIKVERDNEILSYYVTPTEVKIRITGMYLDEKAKVLAVEKNSIAERQGIRANDQLIKMNNVEIQESRDIALEEITRAKEETITVVVKRGNEEVTIALEPEFESTYYLGVGLNLAEDNFINRCINGGMETSNFVFSIFDNLKQLFTGNVGVDQMMGPVGISEVVAKTDGFREFFEMMALISLSLGITNLLPIPALDGGKLLILIIEAIRRKPLKEKTEINIQLIGFSLLIALSVYITYNDILRIF